MSPSGTVDLLCLRKSGNSSGTASHLLIHKYQWIKKSDGGLCTETELNMFCRIRTKKAVSGLKLKSTLVSRTIVLSEKLSYSY